MLRAVVILGALAALGACDKSDGTERSATGQVLEGTVSDEMLPTDRVTSEAPLAEPTAADDKSGRGDRAPRGRASPTPADSAAEPAPQPSETPETAPAED